MRFLAFVVTLALLAALVDARHTLPHRTVSVTVDVQLNDALLPAFKGDIRKNSAVAGPERVVVDPHEAEQRRLEDLKTSEQEKDFKHEASNGFRVKTRGKVLETGEGDRAPMALSEPELAQLDRDIQRTQKAIEDKVNQMMDADNGMGGNSRLMELEREWRELDAQLQTMIKQTQTQTATRGTTPSGTTQTAVKFTPAEEADITKLRATISAKTNELLLNENSFDARGQQITAELKSLEDELDSMINRHRS